MQLKQKNRGSPGEARELAPERGARRVLERGSRGLVQGENVSCQIQTAQMLEMSGRSEVRIGGWECEKLVRKYKARDEGGVCTGLGTR